MILHSGGSVQTAGRIVHSADATGVSALVDPAAVDEDFRGFIQLTIAGLPSGAAIRVEKFQVNNTSGVIDETSILEQSFVLTDGQSNTIDGTANPNVPADSTAADGTIVAQLSFLDDSVPNTIAEYVFRFSSPGAAFSAFTARFTVTDAPDAQKFTGTVTANGAPVPYAHVVLLDPAGGGYDFVAATVTDAAGQYALGADPGEYDLVTVKHGLVGAFGKGVGQKLTDGVDQSVDLTMVPGTRTISGQVRDKGTGAGLPAVQVVFRSQDGTAFTVEYTDASGNFSVAVTPGDWDIEVERNAVNQLGYLAPIQPKSVATSTGNVSNVALALPKATALLHGRVTDSNGVPLVEAEVDAVNESVEFEAYTVTDSNGNYVIAVDRGLWFIAPTAGALQETDYLSPDPETPFVENGQAKQIDFAVVKANARLSGTVRDDFGAAVPDQVFRAEEVSSKKGYFTTFASDDPDGAFDIGLTSGTWIINPDFDEAADTDLIFKLPAALTFADNQTITGVDLRVQEPTRHIHIQVTDEAGEPYEFARIKIYTQVDDNAYVAFATTDEDGAAALPAFDGTWTVSLPGPELNADGFRKPAPFNVTVSGSDPAVAVQLEPLPATGNTLVNLATRGSVQTGENVMIGGLILTGNAPKQVLLRAIGPSLSQAGVAGALADPALTLFDSNGAEIAANDDWVSSPDRQAIIDTTIAPTNDKESAVLRTLLPGNYTARVAGAGDTTGVALVELYDLDSHSSSRLVNISTRGRVQTGEDVLIGGYIVGGDAPQRLVIRAIGPSLTGAGVAGALNDPFLTLFDANGTALRSNDDWQTTQRAELIETMLAPSDAKEAAILTELPPGSYTAVVSGVGGTTGVGLVEVYNITPE